MILTLGVLLAIFVVPAPWSVPVVGMALVVEVAETLFWMRRSRRNPAKAGPETMIGEVARVVTACDPIGEVRFHGELWKARCEPDAGVGQRVRVSAREGLTLVVEHAEPRPPPTQVGPLVG